MEFPFYSTIRPLSSVETILDLNGQDAVCWWMLSVILYVFSGNIGLTVVLLVFLYHAKVIGYEVTMQKEWLWRTLYRWCLAPKYPGNWVTSNRVPKATKCLATLLSRLGTQTPHHCIYSHLSLMHTINLFILKVQYLPILPLWPVLYDIWFS